MDFRQFKPGQVISLPGYIVSSQYGDPTWSSSRLAEHGYTVICQHTLTFAVPADFNAVAAEVASIDDGLEAAANSYHQTVANLKARKEQLLQLTFDSAPATDAFELADEAPANAPQPRFVDIDDDIPF